MTRLRVLLLAAITVVCLVGAVGYFLHARASSAVPVQASAPSADLATLLAEPHVVVRDTALGPDYGHLAVVSLADPDGPRAVTGLSCERVYATADAGVCVAARRGVVQTYALTLLDGRLRPVSRTPLLGLPSRARISADGRLVATTTFVSGHSYASTSFSTATVVRRDGSALGNLETFSTRLPHGQTLTSADRNYWGVTFAADDDTFYATAASGGTTWLVRGSLSRRTMTALRTDAECPSLSPDGTRVAYKKRLGNPTRGVWRIAVLDLASGRETLLAETRSVDDQLEWLDDDDVLYALPRSGSQATTTDVWRVPADGTGRPSVLIEQAESPAVVAM